MVHTFPRSFSRAPRILTAASLVLLLSACGGGNNPPGGTNPPDTDVIPDAFTFAALENAAPNLTYSSTPQTIAGMDEDAEAPISINGDNCSYSINDGDFASEPGSVSNGDSVRVQGKAADDFEASISCTLDIGGVTGAFNITTGVNFSLNVVPGELQFSWGMFTGITRYELTRHNNVTGESVFIADDIEGTINTFTLPVSVLLTDWINDRFILSACNDQGCATLPPVDLVQAMSAQAIMYVKASNTGSSDQFGYSVALSGDTLVIGARSEDSATLGINGDQDNDDALGSGAVYVFRRDASGAWMQEAYLKASNTESGDGFGSSVALSGSTLAVGAEFEGSSNNEQGNNDAPGSGAVYVFRRNDAGTWLQEAYLKASNIGFGDRFGSAVALSEDTLAVGANQEDSNATGIDGNENNDGVLNSGAVYVFHRGADGAWMQQAYLKASNTDANDLFGFSIAMSENTLAVGAFFEDSNATGVNGAQGNDSAENSGAVYVFRRDDTNWTQEAYLKASNTEANDRFGFSVALSVNMLAVGAYLEDSGATGVNGDEGNNGVDGSGAVYVFRRDDTNWTQEAYLKASSTDAADRFGASVALSGDMLAVGADIEDSNATGVNGNQFSNDAENSGAAYIFRRDPTGNWTQSAYLNASNTGADDRFGYHVALSGDTLAVGAYLEDSNATGVNGDQANNDAADSGAVYVY